MVDTHHYHANEIVHAHARVIQPMGKSTQIRSLRIDHAISIGNCTSFSLSAMEHSREFVTSCVVGKDIIPRVGLHQLETLRHNLIQALHKSQEPKVQPTFLSP